MPDTENSRIPVLQVQLDHINENIKTLAAEMREHCRRDEDTRTAVALLQRQQAAQDDQIDKVHLGLKGRATREEVEEVRRLVRNPWAIALGSGATVGVIVELLPRIVAMFTGGGP